MPDGILSYCKAIAEAVDITIMLCNNPFTANADMQPALVARLRKSLGSIRYIEEARMDVGRVLDIVEGTEGAMSDHPLGSYIPDRSSRICGLPAGAAA